MKRGRWFEACGGLGLEYETGINDPDYAWATAGVIEPHIKRKPHFFVVKANGNGGPGHTIGTCWTLDDAKHELLGYAGVTEVLEEFNA